MDSTTDGLIRMAAFTWLADLRQIYGDVVPFSELQKGFPFRNSQVRVLGPQGIFIPQGGSVPLSITTAPPKSGKDRPYDDQIGDDHLLRYKYRGEDINHRENAGLRRAMVENLPLIYFWVFQSVCTSRCGRRSWRLTTQDRSRSLSDLMLNRAWVATS